MIRLQLKSAYRIPTQCCRWSCQSGLESPCNSHWLGKACSCSQVGLDMVSKAACFLFKTRHMRVSLSPKDECGPEWIDIFERSSATMAQKRIYNHWQSNYGLYRLFTLLTR